MLAIATMATRGEKKTIGQGTLGQVIAEGNLGTKEELQKAEEKHAWKSYQEKGGKLPRNEGKRRHIFKSRI